MDLLRHNAFAAPLGVVILALIATVVTLFLPVAPDVTNPLATHTRAATASAPVFLFVGAGLIFLSGLKSFKAETRAAYRSLAFGMLVFSALLIQLVIWGLTDTWDSEWATSGSGIAPYVVAAALVYVGTRKFARVLKVKSLLTRFWVTFIFTLVVALGMGVLATFFVTYDLEGTEFYIAVCSWGAIFLTCASILVFQTARIIGPYYKSAIHWLAVGLASFAAASWHEAINTFWFNNGDAYTDYGFYLLPWIIAGLVLVYASYKFRKLAAFGSTMESGQQVATDNDYIQSIVAVANLASQPKEIDKLLDSFRSTIAMLKPGQTLTAEQKQQFVQIFHGLEVYLLNSDPLRTFSKEELLSHVTLPFRKIVEAGQG